MVAARAENYIEKSKTTYNCIPQTIYIGQFWDWVDSEEARNNEDVFDRMLGGWMLFKLFFGMSMYG